MILSGDWLFQAALRATLLLAGLYAAWRFLPVSRPGLRRWLLLLGAVAVLVSPWLSGWWGLDFRPAGTLAHLAPPPAGAGFWPAVMAGLWLAGSAALALRYFREAVALKQLIRQARPWPGAPALPGLRLLQSPAVSGPCVARGRGPVLLLPPGAGNWSPAQWHMVLAHEQQHIRQQDLWLAWLPRMVQCCFWWHPLALWLKRQFHAESEVLCDQAVLDRTGQPRRDYVEFLLSLDAARLPAAALAMGLKSSLGRRLERLLAPPVTSPRWAASLTMAFLTGLAVCALSLRTLPRPETAAAPPPTVSAGDEAVLRLTADPFPGE